MTRLRAGQLRDRGSFLYGDKSIFSFPSVQTDCHPVACQMGKWVCFRVDKVAGARKLLLISIADIRK